MIIAERSEACPETNEVRGREKRPARDKSLHVSRLDRLPKVHTNWWRIASKFVVIGLLCFMSLEATLTMPLDAALTGNDSSLQFSVLIQSAIMLARLGAHVLDCLESRKSYRLLLLSSATLTAL